MHVVRQGESMILLALGVEHGPKLRGFQSEMRQYVPREHRQLIEKFDAEGCAQVVDQVARWQQRCLREFGSRFAHLG